MGRTTWSKVLTRGTGSRPYDARMLRLLPLCLAIGCLHQGTAAPQAWRAEARVTHGRIDVQPVLDRSVSPRPTANGFVTSEVPWRAEWIRGQRVDATRSAPTEVASALPGALVARLGADFDGWFRTGRRQRLARGGLQSAIDGHRDLDDALAMYARPHASILVTWVADLRVEPLNATGFVGDVVATPAGPVVLDLLEEPHLVQMELGLALVAPDGEVVVRVEHHASSVLSARRDLDQAARSMADQLAEQARRAWAVDDRLEPGSPSDPERYATLF